MRVKLLSSITALALLAACGGGGGSGASFTTLSVLGNGDGIARGVTNTGTEALIYSPDVVTVVASANAASSSDIANVRASDFPITSQSGNARIRSGTMTSNGITLNVTGLEDIRTSDAAVIFMQMPAGYNDISMVTGTSYTNAPTGLYTYNGTQATTSRNTIAPGATGSFTMVADFGQSTFQYNGTSGGVGVSGSGALDTANGRFATSGLSVISGSSTYGGTMHGLMHGSGASATSGVFHTSGSSPAYTGAFIGSR